MLAFYHFFFFTSQIVLFLYFPFMCVCVFVERNVRKIISEKNSNSGPLLHSDLGEAVFRGSLE